MTYGSGDKVLQVTPPAANKVAKYLVSPTNPNFIML